ncbi:hypothetical protein CRE_20715 [Caenorhabditis remanei]|uniref:Uncharacterized protein n=1 Tax=Caenorhabditis remanei TaxID=31234 RepID=E3MFJ1_CAERE|nr:hypothetical protein CRE_20715 [Caenorhabditis remanei]
MKYRVRGVMVSMDAFQAFDGELWRKHIVVEVAFVDVEKEEEYFADAVEKAIRPNTKLIYFETIINPTMTIPDILRTIELAKNFLDPNRNEFQIRVVIDVPFASLSTFNLHVSVFSVLGGLHVFRDESRPDVAPELLRFGGRLAIKRNLTKVISFSSTFVSNSIFLSFT